MIRAFKKAPLTALVGLTLTLLFFLMALFAPLLAPYGLGEVVGNVWEASSDKHWLGTDNIGRDMLTRMIYGGQVTIVIASAATILSFTLGSVLGFTAIVIGGWFDLILSRFVDLIMSIPGPDFCIGNPIRDASIHIGSNNGHGAS